MVASYEGQPRAETTKIEDEVPLGGTEDGAGGIRTHERVAPLAVFKTAAFNHSATAPDWPPK